MDTESSATSAVTFDYTLIASGRSAEPIHVARTWLGEWSRLHSDGLQLWRNRCLEADFHVLVIGKPAGPCVESWGGLGGGEAKRADWRRVKGFVCDGSHGNADGINIVAVSLAGR